MQAFRFTHLDHCTVIVTNLAAARDFYGRQLGLREIAPPREFNFVAVWYDLGGFYLHLLLKPHADTISSRHFCIAVDDIAVARATLSARGLPIEETVRIAAAERFFLRDPDGNRIELIQWLRPYHPATDGLFPV
ncbi:MAG: VOC family protein [Gemmataceae bacterium]